jgi:hypothetical protein
MSREPMTQRVAAIEQAALGAEYSTAQKIAAAAQLLAAQMKPPAPPTATDPFTAGEITEEWIDQTIEVQMTLQRLEKRRGVLLTLAGNARNRVQSAHSAAHSRILAGLHDELQTLLADVRDVSDELGDIATATQAIANDAGPQWKRLAQLADDYAELRSAQLGHMSSEVIHASAPRYPGEPHATDLYLRNLDAIWPQWRQGGGNQHVITLNVNANAHEQRHEPWPIDSTEQLLWLVRSDAEPWVPNEHQLDQLRRERIIARNPMPAQPTKEEARV